MAVWNNNNILITLKGQEMLSKALLGINAITITKVMTGGSSVAVSQLYNQVEVSNPKQTLEIKKKTSSDTGSVVDLQLSNVDLVTGYTLRQVGVYASHPDLGEVLYMIAQCDEPADVIPSLSETPLIMGFSFHLVHSNDLQVNLTIDINSVVTQQDLIEFKGEIDLSITQLISGMHSHNNKTVLDGINAELVADWTSASTLVDEVNTTEKYKFFIRSGKLFIRRVL